MNNPDVQNGHAPLMGRLAQLKVNAIFQLESGEQGTRHYQGVIKFGSARSFTSVKRVLANQSELPGAHWERCRSWKRAVVYCSKEATRLDGPWTVGEVPYRRPVQDFYDTEQESPWQAEVLSVLRAPMDRRSVTWVHEPYGNVGKSTLARHLIGFRYKGLGVLVRGGVGDIHYAVKQHVDEHKRELKLVIVDIPRANQGAVSYQAIEDLKNGMLFSTKYESGHCIFDPPHVVIFSNSPPDLTKLSADRWNVIYAGPPADLEVPAEPLNPASYLGYNAMLPMRRMDDTI